MLTVQANGGLRLSESDLSNMLVGQKNRIIELIDNGFLTEARAAIDVVAELWRTSDYGYKVGELEKRIALAMKCRNVSNSDATPFPESKIWTFDEILQSEG